MIDFAIQYLDFLIELCKAYLEWLNEVGLDVFISDTINILQSFPKTLFSIILTK